METWEVVIILALLTVSIIVISRHKVPTEAITFLDNTIVQIVLLGLTLLAAVASPAVAVVAVTTLVVVYYMRNVVKMQIVQANMGSKVNPQIAIIEEKRITTIVNKDTSNSKENMPSPVSSSHSQTIETALRESNLRPPASNYEVIGTRASLNSQMPPSLEKTKTYATFTDPRGSVKNVEPFDSQAQFNYNVQSSAIDRTIIPEIDSEIFKRYPYIPAPANENTAIANQMRNYAEDNGQYRIDEARPFTVPAKYEEANYNPDDFVGSNNFAPIGVSIDDKVRNMSRGKFVTGSPPPDFDKAVPNRQG
jgi:hypothetical protein